MSQLDAFPEVQLRPEDDPNSRFTTPETMTWVRETCCAEGLVETPLFEFDLDPFAHPEAHWGKEWWTKADNAYARTAFGRTFVNGPWDECANVVAWIRAQFARNFRLDFVAQILPGNRQEQEWWQRLIEPIRDRRERDLIVTTHYPPGRTNYGIPGAPRSTKWRTGLNVNSTALLWRAKR